MGHLLYPFIVSWRPIPMAATYLRAALKGETAECVSTALRDKPLTLRRMVRALRKRFVVKENSDRHRLQLEQRRNGKGSPEDRSSSKNQKPEEESSQLSANTEALLQRADRHIEQPDPGRRASARASECPQQRASTPSGTRGGTGATQGIRSVSETASGVSSAPPSDQ